MDLPRLYATKADSRTQRSLSMLNTRISNQATKLTQNWPIHKTVSKELIKLQVLSS